MRIAILGVGMAVAGETGRQRKLDDLVFESASKALEDASLIRNEIETVVISGCDELDGRCISSMLLAVPAGAYLKDEIKVTDEGAYAVVLAGLRILSGHFDIALIVGWCKTSEASVSDVMRMRWEPFYHRGFGLNHVTASALMAGVYRDRYRVPDSVAAHVAVKNRKNGALNERAHLREPVSLEEVESSPVVSWPLRVLHCAPESDGACALILASERKAAELRREPVWLDGFGWASDSYYLGERDLSFMNSLEIAANKAYRMAGVADPLNEIDVAEISDFTSWHEIMACEALGFCPRGSGPALVKEGITQISGHLPVNPSGGVLSTNPFTASGLFRVAEACLQVRGRAGDRQVSDVTRALAHASAGFCGQSNAVFLLSR